MKDLFKEAQAAAAFISERCQQLPDTAIVLGTGLDHILNQMRVEVELPYHTIPFFPTSTVQSHRSALVIGQLGQKEVIVLAGRFHYYEGYSAAQVAFPVRVLHLLGIKKILMTNAAGSVNPRFKPGHIVLVKDHINLHPDNPLRGCNDERFGPRFPDLSTAYSLSLREKFKSAALKVGHESIPEGVYVGVQGPNLETPSEYKMFHIIGGDLVGMSTIPEVLVANHVGMEVLVASVVTNLCYPPENIQETTLEKVIEVARRAGNHLGKILIAMIN